MAEIELVRQECTNTPQFGEISVLQSDERTTITINDIADVAGDQIFAIFQKCQMEKLTVLLARLGEEGSLMELQGTEVSSIILTIKPKLPDEVAKTAVFFLATDLLRERYISPTDCNLLAIKLGLDLGGPGRSPAA